MSKREIEHKQLPFFLQKLNEDQGIVDAIVAVMGNVDEQMDIIENGSFTKTISERAGKIRVLDNHNLTSVKDVVGKVISMREMTKDELPGQLKSKYPDATGGLFASIQFLLDTPEGEGVFKRIKAGAVDEYSIGYDALDTAYENMQIDGKEQAVRRLKTIRLWEISPVVFAANDATMTASAKAAPSEDKPYRAVREGDRWAVYKLDEDDQPTGSPLGTHDTEAGAQAQVRALYANEADDEKAVTRSEADGQHPASHYLVVEDPEKPTTWHLRVRNAAGELDHRLMGAAWAALHGGYRGNIYEGPGKQEAIAKLTRLYEREGLDTPSKALDWALPIWQAAHDYDHEAFMHYLKELDNAPQTEAAIDMHEPEQAGPDADGELPTSEDMLQLIQLEELEMSLMEV